jgi:hypothetical protein
MPTLTDTRDPQYRQLMEAVWRVYTAVIVLLIFLSVSSVSVHSTHYSLIVKYAVTWSKENHGFDAFCIVHRLM